MPQTNAGNAPALLRVVEGRSATAVALASLVLLVVLGWLDLATGWELSFSIFYFVPVALGSWRGGSRAAIALALASGVVWYSADQLAGHMYSRSWTPYWNAFVRFGMFLALGLTLAALRAALQRANALARIDALTGVANSRAFQEQLLYHMESARRHRDPITLAAIDLDNFKTVNDIDGHAGGDDALVKVARVLTNRLRAVDVIARIGGDEFAALLPRTSHDGAVRVLEEVRSGIEADMLRDGRPITASIGVVSCRGDIAPAHLLEVADRALYRAKADGRNRIVAERIGAS
ncbi:MAG TPA: GGDEF domain-containing protein [Longimicrobiales bacterium]|nr:GGDEF domain-containing protein [Longimicrobiales bacterium]